jgi:hypothetical protein
MEAWPSCAAEGRSSEVKGAGDGTRPDGSYVLGHSDRELERLNRQARLVDPITRRFPSMP